MILSFRLNLKISLASFVNPNSERPTQLNWTEQSQLQPWPSFRLHGHWVRIFVCGAELVVQSQRRRTCQYQYDLLNYWGNVWLFHGCRGCWYPWISMCEYQTWDSHGSIGPISGIRIINNDFTICPPRRRRHPVVTEDVLCFPLLFLVLFLFLAEFTLAFGLWKGRLKMREWKMRYGQNCKGGKCRSGKSRSR